MNRIFQVKILRQKILGVGAVVLLVAFLLLFLMYYRMKNEWIDLSRNEAAEIQALIEQALMQEDNLLSIQLNSIYAYPALLTDLKNVLRSDSFEEYLASRLRESRLSSQSIRSFPEFIRGYIRKYDSALYKLVLADESGRNLISFGSGDVKYEFAVSDDSPQRQMNIAKDISMTRTVYDTSANFENMGTLTFFYDIKKLIQFDIHHQKLLLAAMVDQSGNCFFITGEQSRAASMVENVLKQDANTGTLDGGFLNQIYYSVLESPQYQYRLVVCVDDQILMANNANTLILPGAIILAISTAFIFVFLYNMRYDFVFIKHIYESIESVKRAEFDENVSRELKKYRANEYGSIARELDDMCLKLKRHITTEYQLKIKQQETEMRALQHQINPHFLYNTLEVIRSTALLNDDRASAAAIAALGSLYRDIVKGDETCTVQAELSLLEKYLQLMQLRYPDNFFYQIQAARELRMLSTVKFWMQPLAENFFAHGFDKAKSVNILVVEGRIREGGFLFEMTDNGHGLPEAEMTAINQHLLYGEELPSAGIGLSNVYMRLKFFYGDGFQMYLRQNPEGGIKVCVSIPEGGDEHV